MKYMFGTKIITDEQKIEELLSRGVDEAIEFEHLKARLLKGDKLRVKLGIDPTAKDLHLGHTVVLKKLKQFQDLGHTAVFIIGDFTATIGDPSGRNELRPQLTGSQIKDNMKNYLAEASKVIDVKKAEIHYNSEWYKNKEAWFLMELTSKFTLARALERDDFQKRIKNDQDVGLLEILYPLFQGYDSVAVRADVEIGGTDQKFNLLTGRKVQRRYDQPEQDIITCPLIEGMDGVKKMSKSTGNYIGLSDNSGDMFGKIMSVPDGLMVKYFKLLTNVSDMEVENIKNDILVNPSMAKKSPKEWKQTLAQEIVKMYHGEKEAKKAKEEWEKVFSNKEMPSEIQEAPGEGMRLVDFITEHALATSSSEAKRLLDQGAVSVNEEVVKAWGHLLKKEDVIRVGSRKFLKVF